MSTHCPALTTPRADGRRGVSEDWTAKYCVPVLGARDDTMAALRCLSPPEPGVLRLRGRRYKSSHGNEMGDDCAISSHGILGCREVERCGAVKAGQILILHLVIGSANGYGWPHATLC
ncbi:hypothetical protein E4T56_gene12933 [Termitomyces sp. T112]|nr:hypothetical protein E4T56_gene12933 [Termitomyces sp. T112]